jgi:predicted DNA-binding transcriptional regulator AlpA
MAAISPAALHTDNFIDAHQLADWLGVSEGWLRVLRVKGGGPPYRKIGAAVRYRVGDVLAWTESRSATSTSDAPVAA